MNAILNEKANRSKLLAAVAVLALVVCAFVAILPAGEVSADPEYSQDGTQATVGTAEDFATALANESVTTIVLSDDITLDSVLMITKDITIIGTNGDEKYTITTPSTGYGVQINGVPDSVIDVVFEDLAISGAVNVFAANVDLTGVDISADGRAGLVIGYQSEVNATDITVKTENNSWKYNVNVDKGGVFNLDTIAGVGSIYSENSLYAGGETPVSEINVPDADFTVAQDKADDNNEPVGYFSEFSDMVEYYNQISTSSEENFEIGINADAAITPDVMPVFTENTAIAIADDATLSVETMVDFKGASVSGNIEVDDKVPLSSFPSMTDGELFPYQGDDYIVYNYSYRGINYQYGLAVHSIEYDGTDVMDSELSIIPIALPIAGEGQGTLQFSNTDSKWYDSENGTYEGALKSENDEGEAPGSTGLYSGVIRFSASISADKAFSGNTLTQYLDLNITPGQYTGVIDIEGWTEGQYDASVNGPSITVTTVTGEDVPADQYTVTYEYFTDAACTKTAGTDPSSLVAGTYYVKATVTPVNPNFVVNVESVKFIVDIDQLESEVIFHPLQDLNDDVAEEAILGINPDDIQKIAFNTEDGIEYIVNGTVYKTKFDAESKIVGLDKLGLTSGAGYFIAFYVEGVGFDITSIPAAEENLTDYITYALSGTNATNNKITEITPEENATEYRYYLMYVADLGADTADASTEPTAGQDGFTYTVDFDKATGEKYAQTEYDVDLSYLNYYLIILHDDKEPEDNYYNDLLKYYRADGSQFVLPSGAGDAFKYWTTESGSTNDRVFEFGSIMLVGAQYDPDSDGVINLQAYYGESTPGQPGETDPATEVLIFIGSSDNGVNIMLYGVDGYVPTGATVVVTYSYIMTVNGINYSVPVSMEAIVVDNADNLGAVLIPVALDGEENYSTINSVFATLTIDGVSNNTDTIAYTPVTA